MYLVVLCFCLDIKTQIFLSGYVFNFDFRNQNFRDMCSYMESKNQASMDNIQTLLKTEPLWKCVPARIVAA